MATSKTNPMATALGTSLFSPDQMAWRNAQRRIGPLEVDGGQFPVTKMNQDDDGTCWVYDLEPDSSGWIDPDNLDFGRVYQNRGRPWI